GGADDRDLETFRHLSHPFLGSITLREPLNKSWHLCLAHEIAQIGVTNLAHSPRYGLRFVP
ncbi:MAG: hypothetical protein O7B81_12135, partial [Gammaproteobacteria bacterium]|nr:hypothetical protein [Gammaproteobacteria bacterium]